MNIGKRIMNNAMYFIMQFLHMRRYLFQLAKETTCT